MVTVYNKINTKFNNYESAVWIGIKIIWIQKITYKKSAIFIWFFSAKMSQYSHTYIASNNNWRHFSLRVSTYFYLEVSRQFDIENNKQKISNIHEDIFELYQLLMKGCLWKTVSKSSFYMLLKLLNTWLTQFCIIIQPNLFIYNLAYTTRTEPVFLVHLNYENMLKCVNTTNFLSMILNFRKAETA